jgi:hypothetical protein
VAQVMEERREANDARLGFGEGRRLASLAEVDQPTTDAIGDVPRPEAVLEPCVRRTREDEHGHRQLVDPPKALERGGVDEVPFLLGQFDLTPHRIPDVPGSCH